MYSIGEFANEMKVTQKTLRHYEKVGILKPHKIDQDNGYRYYSDEEEIKLSRILELKMYGFTLKEIQECLNTPIEKLQSELSLKIDMANQNIFRNEMVKNKLERILKIKGVDNMKKDNMLVISKDAEKKNKYVNDCIRENMNSSLVLINFDEENKKSTESLLKENGYGIYAIGENENNLRCVFQLIYGMNNAERFAENLELKSNETREIAALIIGNIVKYSKRKNIKNIIEILEEAKDYEMFIEKMQIINKAIIIDENIESKYNTIREELINKLNKLKSENYEIPFEVIEENGKRKFKAKLHELFHPKMLRMRKAALYINGSKEEVKLMLLTILENFNVKGEEVSFIIKDMGANEKIEGFLRKTEMESDYNINYFNDREYEMINKELFAINVNVN